MTVIIDRFKMVDINTRFIPVNKKLIIASLLLFAFSCVLLHSFIPHHHMDEAVEVKHHQHGHDHAHADDLHDHNAIAHFIAHLLHLGGGINDAEFCGPQNEFRKHRLSSFSTVSFGIYSAAEEIVIDCLNLNCYASLFVCNSQLSSYSFQLRGPPSFV